MVMSSKRVVLHILNTNFRVTYFRGVKVFYSKSSYGDKAVKVLRSTIGFAGLEQYIPEYAAVFLDALRDLATASEDVTQTGWVSESRLYAALRAEIPGLMEVSVTATEGRRYTVDVVGTDLRRVLGPLESLVERQTSGDKGNPTHQVRYRLNPLLLEVSSPRAVESPEILI
jgi:hypothetical protein